MKFSVSGFQFRGGPASDSSAPEPRTYNPKPGTRNWQPLILLSLFLVLVLFSGCAQESDSEYVVHTDSSGEITEIGGFTPANSQTIIGGIVQEWRAFSVIFMMLSIGLIALAYPISHALELPSLKAWADVELGESFSTAFVVAVTLGVLVFVELLTQGVTGNLPGDYDCTGSMFCPVTIAEAYINDYLSSSLAIYGDLFENAAEAGKLATLSAVLGSNWMWTGYLSFSSKITPHFMIEVTMIGQEMQFLLGMRDGLVFQQFVLRHVSSTLAPMALMLGIILRSFFLTRKLGGLLMAFGIGFLLVFPATYALAMFTLHNTIYGATVTGGDVTNEFCTASCRKLPPLAYNRNTGDPYTYSNLSMVVFPQEPNEDDDEHRERIDDFVSGEHCYTVEGAGNAPDTIECDQFSWNELRIYSEEEEADIISCARYRDICPQECREIPYPNYNIECASRMTEYNCREHVTKKCFVIREADMDDPMLSGLADGDAPGGSEDTCPEKCRPLNAMKKSGCDVGYGFILWPDIKEVGDANEVLDSDEYLDEYMDEGGLSISEVCVGHFDYLKDTDMYNTMITRYCANSRDIYKTLNMLGFEDLEENVTVIWDEGCPNRCRWVSTEGRTDIGCRDLCDGMPDSDEEGDWGDFVDGLKKDWEDARDADSDEQMEIAKDQCYMVIPEEVFTSPDCLSCDYLIDPGFGSYPPMHHRCDKLCGGKKNVVAVKDTGSMAASTEGFDGPAEMKEITKLIVPAVVLPMFNLVITFIFIRTLSPILGGDIDIPGMMGMIK